MPGSRLGAEQIGPTSVLDPQAEAHLLLLERAHSELRLQMKDYSGLPKAEAREPWGLPAPSRKGSHTACPLASPSPSRAYPKGIRAKHSDLSCRVLQPDNLPWGLLRCSSFSWKSRHNISNLKSHLLFCFNQGSARAEGKCRQAQAWAAKGHHKSGWCPSSPTMDVELISGLHACPTLSHWGSP